MKKNFFITAVLFVIVVLSMSSCAVSAQYHYGRPCSSRPVYTASRAVATGAQILTTITIIEQEIALAKSRYPIKNNGVDVTYYGGPGNQYAYGVYWADSKIESNGYNITFTKYGANNTVIERVGYNLNSKGIHSHVVQTNCGQREVKIYFISGRVELHYVGGNIPFKLLAGK